jgi:DNA mismatch endonuclease (patch repair protein)
MADIFNEAKRKQIMKSIKGKNSKAERTVFAHLNKQKIYYQKHYQSKYKINIDIALPRKKVAIFIDGDFWHGASLNKLIEQRGHEDYWTRKIQRNKERDVYQTRLLLENGWKVLRIWESDINRKKTRDLSLQQIQVALIKPAQN